MKYIRTKDGRILENNTRFNDKTLEEVSRGLIDIVKQSDTLEDLFDCLVLILNGKPIVIEKGKQYTITGGRMCGKTAALSGPYGAVWIFDEDNVPELKCVAKQRRGEWELL